MSNIPDKLSYASSHEWLNFEDNGEVTIGITDYAQGSLGDLVFVELPHIGDEFSAGDQACVIESVKAASDIYCPISGKIVAVNDNLSTNPELINLSPYEDGWIFRIKPSNINEYASLLDAQQYKNEIA